MTCSLAVDIGGTFTDIVLLEDNGRITVDKTLTTPKDLLAGFFGGVHQVLQKAKRTARDVDGIVVHATTVVTNALIERKGPPTALVLTHGFRDVLTIRNEHRYDMYDPQIELPDPLIPDALTFTLDERTLADGTVIKAPSTGDIDKLAAEIKASGARSAAICFLNSYVNAQNERAVAAALTAKLPGVFICTSSDVAPQIREYPRASTTAINAYTMPISEPYLKRLIVRLGEEGFASHPLIMLSSGGVVGAETAGRNPVRMIESGPAAGALAACHFAELLGIDRLMSFDMGGTTAKACLIEHRKPLVTGLFEVDRRYRFKDGSGQPVTVPSIDLIEIGAGGGSIAHVDDLGLLKVGPHSAGADPGPACYGRGGQQATVTDADLALGLIDAENFLGGDMKLDTAAMEAAMERLGASLGIGARQAARGIYRVVTEAMASAARAHATDRGVDYRGLPLFAFGGAGPLHACGVAELIESAAVIVPPNSSVLSAFGTLVTPVRLDLVRSALGRLDAINWGRVESILGELEEEGRAALRLAGCKPEQMRSIIGVDMRYAGQQNEVTVELDVDPRKARSQEKISAAFVQVYKTLYGMAPTHVPMEIVTWRVTVEGPPAAVKAQPRTTTTPGKPKGHRTVHAWKDGEKVAVYDRVALAVGQTIKGPAIIEERETTTAIAPGWTARIDPAGCIVAERKR